MIELRWVIKQDDMNISNRTLQYRQLVDKNVYAGFNRPDSVAPNMQWSDWRDVPEVPDIDPSCP